MFKTHAELTQLPFETLARALRGLAQETGATVLEDGDAALRLEGPHGRFGIRARGAGLRIELESARRDHLVSLREGLAVQVAALSPELGAALRWAEPVAGAEAGALPTNFQFATLSESAPLGADFWRLTLRPDRPEAFGPEAIHFRFALPAPDNDAPEWPRLSETGALRWPEGDKALHRPVYTTRAIAGGAMIVDIYRHPGGRMSDWAAGARPGARVALIGPGGAGLVAAQELIMGADETGYPAVARIVEALPEGARATVFLRNRSGARDYPMPSHPGLDLRWFAPGEDLVGALEARITDAPGSYLWFGGPKREVAALRAGVAPLELGKGRSYLAGFWSEG
ncbi:siderophore-interacting protein [Poseidonocella sedimentorum]|uniref:NADPH-dependent ferric siderophore reductase, contains FAD-binding and SIP domains n=1 Tax=Poseidonocella sedimentorum TaxID=871652 RepID=A0A1I6E3L3_9RHOB|nr:siderophore-interacting protein [Poseidonocella sedimentorum]SFR12132.1 NADPH-dependent ferric siderophore reductase, contains FAD-binding and SIP domains [Poseidonocella sedimentorum]